MPAVSDTGATRQLLALSGIAAVWTLSPGCLTNPDAGMPFGTGVRAEDDEHAAVVQHVHQADVHGHFLVCHASAARAW